MDTIYKAGDSKENNKLSKDQYKNMVVEYLHKSRPDMEANPTIDEFAIDIKGPKRLFLTTPYIDSEKNNFANWQSDFERYLESVNQNFDIVSERWEDINHKVHPQIKTTAQINKITSDLLLRDDNILYKDLLGDLKICFVLDQQKNFVYITDKTFNSYNIQMQALEDKSLENLENLYPSMQGPQILDHGDGSVSLAWESMDGYDAARILLPNFYEGFSSYLGETFLVSIPHRDFLLGTPVNFFDTLKQYAYEEFAKSAHPITPQIIQFSPSTVRIIY